VRRGNISPGCWWLALVGLVLGPTPLVGAETARPTVANAVRLVGPNQLAPDTHHLVRVEVLLPGKRQWQLADPDQFTVTLQGALELVADPAAVLVNPFAVKVVLATPVPQDGKSQSSPTPPGTGLVRINYQGVMHEERLQIGPQAPVGKLTVSIDPSSSRCVKQQLDGFGGGVMFYDNQWELSSGDELYRWCFADVQTSLLHLLIRPDFEPSNDNDDWQQVDWAEMDFRAAERCLNIAHRAKQIRPQLKLYASLYSPPAWMKTEGTTSGKQGLRPGPSYPQELAEYVFAFLKHAAERDVPIDYLALFNEPDWPHNQDGLYVPDAAQLCQLFGVVTDALEELLSASKDAPPMPRLVFPDALGAGSITRHPKNRAAYLANQQLLQQRVAVWGVHDYWNAAGYWPARFEELREFPPVAGKRIWMTEWAQRYRRGDLASANEYGLQMLNALRRGAQAWLVFEWCHPGGNQSGLISTDWQAAPPRQRYWRSKAYHVFAQIANTTPPGSTVIQPAQMELVGREGDVGEAPIEVLTVRVGDTLVVHLANASGEPLAYSLRWKLKRATNTSLTADGRVTDPLKDNQPLKPTQVEIDADRQTAGIEGVLPANSLLTRRLPLADSNGDTLGF
jgi:O-glycosyl hydrolase